MSNLILIPHRLPPPSSSTYTNYLGGWCKHLDRKNRVKSSIIAPQNIGCIYRAFGRFMKDHVPSCMHIPTDLRLLDAKKTDIVHEVLKTTGFQVPMILVFVMEWMERVSSIALLFVLL